MSTKEKIAAHETEWYKSLKPFAEDWCDMREKIRNRVRELSDEELKKLKTFLIQPTRTNCWFAIYQVAREQLPEIVRDEMLDRDMIEE